MSELVCCVDFGSTYTKAALVDVADARLVATAAHRTTIDTDVLDGWDAIHSDLAAAHPGVRAAEVLACSSAGGGLRIAVVGNEELVTAEAGRRVALSSGGKVVAVLPGGLSGSGPSQPGYDDLTRAEPDVVLLVGGTDGGNPEPLLSAARSLAERGCPWPVVVAGDVTAQHEVTALLGGADIPHVVTANVVPQIGVLRPEPARVAIREMFLTHVIGGKGLSRRTDFTAMVRGATPDVVLTAVELLASVAGDVVIVDVGGATTDVHSVVAVGPADPAADAGLAREVVAPTAVSRTVEGDLGMRWSAGSTVSAGREAGLLEPEEYAEMQAGAMRRQEDPSYLAQGGADHQVEQRLATVACGLALRRHAGRQRVSFSSDGRLVERTGKDLREVDLLIGSGGVLRHHPPAFVEGVLTSSVGHDLAGGWLLPQDPRIVVDREYVLAAAGLLAADHPRSAAALVGRLATGGAQVLD